MEKEVKPLTEGFGRKFRNPIIAGFVLSWIVFNWKFLLFLMFSKLTIEKKFEAAKTTYLNGFSGFLFPFLVSIFLYIAIPYLTVFLDNLLEHSKQLRKRKVINSQVKLLEDEQKLLYAQNRYFDRDELIKTIENLASTNEDLKERIDEFTIQLNQHRDSLAVIDELITIKKQHTGFVNPLQTSNVNIMDVFPELVRIIHSPKNSTNNRRFANLILDTPGEVKEIKRMKLIVPVNVLLGEDADKPYEWEITERGWKTLEYIYSQRCSILVRNFNLLEI